MAYKWSGIVEKTVRSQREVKDFWFGKSLIKGDKNLGCSYIKYINVLYAMQIKL